MKYNLANNAEAGRAVDQLLTLTKAGKIAEVKEIKPRRSLNQNSYLHLLLGAFGAHFGYTLDEAKEIYKQLNKQIYMYEREVRGKTWQFYRSSADLDKEEMAKSIDTLMQWSLRAGYPLPPATDQEWLRQIENEIERAGAYL